MRFKQRLDSSSKIYIPKVLREAGFDNEIEIAPNTRAFVAFPSGVPLDQVLTSLHIIKQDLQQSAKLQAEERARPRKKEGS